MRELPVRPALRGRRHARASGPRLAAQGQRVPLRGQAGPPLRAPRRAPRPTDVLVFGHTHKPWVHELRRRAVRQLRLGRQAQGRRPARRVRRPAARGRRRRGHDRARRVRRRGGRRARSPRSGCPSEFADKLAARRVTAAARPAAARRVPRQRVPRRAGHRLRASPPSSSPSDTGLQLLENAAATAAGLFAIILMFGPVSGGHFNPVVSLVDAAFGGLSRRDALAYIPAQIAGCITGAVVANGMFALAAISISRHHRASPAHLFAEVIATCGLLLVIFALARSGRAATAPAAVGAYIGAAYWFTSSTSFANPAISVGRMFSDTFAGIAPASVPAFVVAQLVGGAAALWCAAPAPSRRVSYRRAAVASPADGRPPAAWSLARNDAQAAFGVVGQPGRDRARAPTASTAAPCSRRGRRRSRRRTGRRRARRSSSSRRRRRSRRSRRRRRGRRSRSRARAWSCRCPCPAARARRAPRRSRGR